MKLSVRFLALALPAVLVVLPWQTQAEDKPKSKDTKEVRDAVMARKLAHAKDILEGLSIQDFDKLIKSADGLIKCREEVTWRLDQTEDYLFYSNAFLRQCEEIKAAAKKKNVEAATLAYLDMTRTCVKCHEHLRMEKGKKDN
jgi:hypothetical protein